MVPVALRVMSWGAFADVRNLAPPPIIVAGTEVPSTTPGLRALEAKLPIPWAAFGDAGGGGRLSPSFLVEIAVEAGAVGPPAKGPVSVAVVLGPSDSPLQTRQALVRVWAELGPCDRITLVPLDTRDASSEGLAGTGKAKETLAARVKGLRHARPRTLDEQLRLAHALLEPTRRAFSVNRIVLVMGTSRPDPRSVAEHAPLVALVRQFAKDGSSLSAFGLGAGEEGLLRALVGAGGGGFMRGGEPTTFRQSNFFGREAPAARNLTVTLAGAPICVPPNPSVVGVWTHGLARGERVASILHCMAPAPPLRSAGWSDTLQVTLLYDVAGGR